MLIVLCTEISRTFENCLAIFLCVIVWCKSFSNVTFNASTPTRLQCKQSLNIFIFISFAFLRFFRSQQDDESTAQGQTNQEHTMFYRFHHVRWNVEQFRNCFDKWAANEINLQHKILLKISSNFPWCRNRRFYWLQMYWTKNENSDKFYFESTKNVYICLHCGVFK